MPYVINFNIMWKQNSPGTPGDEFHNPKLRPIRVTKELRKALKVCATEKHQPIQQIFNKALVSLWRLYNGNTTSNEPANSMTEKKLVDILDSNPMPGIEKNTANGKSCYIYVKFRGQQTYEWATNIEKLYMTHGLDDFVRRVISWYLRDQGFIKNK